MKRRTRSQDPRPSRASRPRPSASSSSLSPMELARFEFTLEAVCPGISLMSDALGFDCLYSIFCRVETPGQEVSISEIMSMFCYVRFLEVRSSVCEDCGSSCECGFSLWSLREGRSLADY